MQGVRVPVERSLTVTVEAKDEEGNDVRLELEGLTARVAQHETDHLDGMLILDRTDHESRGRRSASSGRSPSFSRLDRLGVAATAPFGADVLERWPSATTSPIC